MNRPSKPLLIIILLLLSFGALANGSSLALEMVADSKQTLGLESFKSEVEDPKVDRLDPVLGCQINIPLSHLQCVSHRPGCQEWPVLPGQCAASSIRAPPPISV